MSDLPVLISTHEPFVTFSLPCPAEEGSDRAALVGTWHPARVNPPQMIWYLLKDPIFLFLDFNYMISAISVVTSLCMEGNTEETFLNHPKREVKKT